ncbi:MAG: exosome complex RNA-binding protein Rrp4 [Candidatus Bathyarchaeota archaeon]|nr:exosome complex RNA-binding protein Rrp4 [Candidatus Bathyarchaeota archaeon]MDH5595626.1 exosome complex RNA-binding protein Rrp4 [Candidatus Bathyarchaeota archaeon]
MPTFYENKQLVTPGDLLAEGNYVAGENAYEEDGKIYSAQLGLVDYEERRVHVVALRAFYIPYIGDTVIGKVVDVGFSGWMLDINASYLAMLRASDVLDRPFKPQKNDLSSIFNIGDLIIAKVVAYNRTRDPLLTVGEPSLGKVTRGQIVKVTPTKIPRLIGRQGSMISMLKRETGCHITLGQNGLVLVSGKTLEDEQLAIMAIRKIDQEAHTSGLTDRVTKMIQKKKGGVKHAQKDD